MGGIEMVGKDEAGGAASSRAVLVVDDHSTLVELLEMAVGDAPGLTCVGTATDGAGALERVERLSPDVVLLDVQLGAEDGIELASTLLERRPGLCVVVLTAHADGSVVRRAMSAGVAALLAKDGSLSDLISTLRTADPGGFRLDRSLLRTVVDKPVRTSEPVRPALTPRELEVLRLLASGRDTRAVARTLGISLHTCRGYIKRVLVKLDAHSQLEAVTTAARAGLIHVSAES